MVQYRIFSETSLADLGSIIHENCQSTEYRGTHRISTCDGLVNINTSPPFEITNSGYENYRPQSCFTTDIYEADGKPHARRMPAGVKEKFRDIWNQLERPVARNIGMDEPPIHKLDDL